MKNKYNLIFSLCVLINLINIIKCLSDFDDDYNEFGNNFADPFLDIKRTVKPNLYEHNHKISDSFDFDHSDQFKNEFKNDYKLNQFKDDDFKTDFKDDFKREQFKYDPFKSDSNRDNLIGRPNSFKKENNFKDESFRNDNKVEIQTTNAIKPTRASVVVLDKSTINENYENSKKIKVLRKRPKNDSFNKSDSFLNEFDTNFEDVGRMPDFDLQEHDAWFEQPRDFELTRRDRVSEKLIQDYRQPTPRTPFRVPMIPVPAFYPQPVPILPTPFIPQLPLNRPQPQLPQQQISPQQSQLQQQQQQQQQQQPQNRPSRPQNQQPQQNMIPNMPPGWFYPGYPFYPVPMMPQQNSIPNAQIQGNSAGNSHNIQLQHALQNMMNRNSFLGFVDPLIIVALIAIPVIAMLGFSSVVMPFIPVIIYILNIFFPLNAARRRRKRSILSNEFCLLYHNLSKDQWLSNLKRTNNHLIYEVKMNELEHYLKKFHRSICNQSHNF